MVTHSIRDSSGSVSERDGLPTAGSFCSRYSLLNCILRFFLVSFLALLIDCFSMSYKKKADANRDALFGGASAAAAPKAPKSSSSNNSSSRAATTSSSSTTSSRGYQSSSKLGSSTTTSRKKTSRPGSLLSPEARAAKLQEAQENKDKANKAMQKSFFSKPDPVAASTFFKRAADCYQAVGDLRLERLYRTSSGDCNMQCGAWASAAGDYTRAAELLVDEYDDEPSDASKVNWVQIRRDAASLHKKAAEAWKQMGEKAKAAASQVQAAIILNHGEEGTMLSKEALAGMEEAVEAHVPDVFNPYARYRQTGHSAFIDPDSEETVEHPSQETIDMAREHMVSRSYAHEPLQQLVSLLVGFGEYASALYAAGAATAILEADGISTLSLSRQYVVETILTLAMGDPVAAEQAFLSRHVQRTAYLSSRECKLAEDLFRAIKTRDGDALEEARSPTGPNKTALANLPTDQLRALVQQLRLSGVARKKVDSTITTESGEKPKKKSSSSKSKSRSKSPKSSIRSKESSDPAAAAAPPPATEPSTAPTPDSSSLDELMKQPTGYEKDAAEGAALDSDALAAELDDLDFGDLGGSDEEDEGLEDDDDLDLR